MALAGLQLCGLLDLEPQRLDCTTLRCAGLWRRPRSLYSSRHGGTGTIAEAMDCVHFPAQVCAIALPGRAPGSREPHNTPLHLTGGFLALVGAYAMIAGGAQGALTHASTALLGTHMAAAGGAVVYALLARALERRW